MCQPSKWWWGILPLAFLWLFSHEILAPTIETELGAQAKAALKASGPAGAWATAKFDGRDAIIEGAAPSAEFKQFAMDNIGTLEGVRLVDDAATVLQAQKPFTWSATREGSGVTLSGFVTPGNQRAKLVADAKKLFPGAAVIDQMKDGNGANAAIGVMTAFGLSQLAKLKSGTVGLSDAAYSIKGSAVDAASFTSLTAETRNLPKPMTMADSGIAAPGAAPAAKPAPLAASPTVLTPAAPAPTPTAPVAAVSPPIAAPAAPVLAPAPAAPAVAALPVVSPYLWSAEKSADGITLTGSVPSDGARAVLLGALKATAPNAKITDQLKLATGLPAGVDYAVATGFATSILSNLKVGTAKLSDGALTLSGEASDASTYVVATKALGAPLPGGLKIGSASVLPPRVADYVLSGRQESGTVTLTGFYPDDATRQAIRSVVSLKFPGARVDDKLAIASGAPAGLGAAAQLGLTQLALLETGSTSVDAKKLTLTGMASSDAIANDVKAAIAKGAGGIPGDANITFRPAPVVPPAAMTAPAPAAATPVTPVTPAPAPAPAAPKAPAVIAAQPTAPAPTPPPGPPASAVAAAKSAPPKPAAPAPTAPTPAVAGGDACEQDLGTAMKASRILFESSSAVLRKESQPVLLQIAAAIKRCGDRKIAIGGHTDSTGTPGFNETLSKNRAKAVADVLVKTGIPMSRLQVTGYGPAQPVAPNDTTAGKLQNRRIEFSLAR